MTAPPDASQHRPDPAYLRELVDRSGLTQREAARRLGVGDRTMRHWLRADRKAHEIPYTAQYCLERLADE